MFPCYPEKSALLCNFVQIIPSFIPPCGAEKGQCPLFPPSLSPIKLPCGLMGRGTTATKVGPTWTSSGIGLSENNLDWKEQRSRKWIRGMGFRKTPIFWRFGEDVRNPSSTFISLFGSTYWYWQYYSLAIYTPPPVLFLLCHATTRWAKNVDDCWPQQLLIWIGGLIYIWQPNRSWRWRR